MFPDIKKYISIVAVSFIMLLSAICYFLGLKITKLDTRLASANNNYKYYESLFSNSEKENRVLLLTADQLNHSKDSLIQAVVEAKKKLKVKDQNLESAYVINTEMKDTTSVNIITKEIDFTLEIKPNSLTTIIVNRKDSILTAILDIKNQLILLVEEKKEYRNKYKNGWSRFWNFDFKKDVSRKYQIINSNPLIQVTDTRVVEVAK